MEKAYQAQLIEDKKEISSRFLSSGKKVSGSIAANLIKKYIELVLAAEKLPYEVSPINSYIYGCSTEWDALLLKKNARDEFGCGLYEAQDVVAVLEFKASGIFFGAGKRARPDDKPGTRIPGSPKEALKIFFHSYKELKAKNSGLKAAYITLSEQNPAAGTGTKYLDATIRDFYEELNFDPSNPPYRPVFCFEERASSSLYDNGCTWAEFVLGLLPE